LSLKRRENAAIKRLAKLRGGRKRSERGFGVVKNSCS